MKNGEWRREAPAKQSSSDAGSLVRGEVQREMDLTIRNTVHGDHRKFTTCEILIIQSSDSSAYEECTLAHTKGAL